MRRLRYPLFNWTTQGQKLLDRIQDTSLTRDRIACAKCYQKRNKSLLRKATGKDESAEIVFANMSNYPRMPKESTWQEWAGKDLGDQPLSETKHPLAYLLRVHGVDFNIDKTVAQKMAEDDMRLDCD